MCNIPHTLPKPPPKTVTKITVTIIVTAIKVFTNDTTTVTKINQI